jgi:drug/metabolite transporter (DMT)-like permease
MLKTENTIDKYFTLIFFAIPLTWAGSFIAGKYLIQDIGPVEAVLLRFLLSGIILLSGLMIWRRKTHPNFLEKGFLIHLTGIVLMSGVGYHVLFFWAFKYASPTNIALIIALNPFFTAFGERIFFNMKRSMRFYAGFLMAFSGATWVIVTRGNGFSLPGTGELLCLISALLWSGYTIFARKTKQPHWDSMWISMYNYLFTALVLLPFATEMLMPGFWEKLTFSGWNAVLYMAIFPTALGYTLFYVGVQKKGPAWAATFIYLVPSLTANLDHLFFDAQLTLPMVMGTTVTVVGLMVGNLTQPQITWLTNKVKRV